MFDLGLFQAYCICTAWIRKQVIPHVYVVWMKHWIWFVLNVSQLSACSLFSLSFCHCPFISCTVSFLPSECVNAFALVVRPPTEQENLLFSFQLAGEETVKSAWLRTLCRHVANTICRADAVSRHTYTLTQKGTAFCDRSAGREGRFVNSSWHGENRYLFNNKLIQSWSHPTLKPQLKVLYS